MAREEIAYDSCSFPDLYAVSSTNQPLHTQLSRRESQIMDVIYQLGEASVADVVERMPDDPSYNTVRNTLGILEEKGYVTHQKKGRCYIYSPTLPAQKAKRSAMQHMLKTFFSDSPSKAILALLNMSDSELSEEELQEISSWIDEAKRGD